MCNALDIRGFIALAFLFGTASAQPFDAKAVFYDAKTAFYSESTLRGALGNIAQMAEPELRVFTHYLAECSDDTADSIGKHACAAAAAAYEIEFSDKRPLDDMILAKKIMDQLPPDPDDRARIVEISIKYAKVIAALEQAATARFRQLKASKK
jgi:hypothetical protein